MTVLWFLIAAGAALVPRFALSADVGPRPASQEKFYSTYGRENVVEFRGVFRTEFATLVQVRSLDRDRYLNGRIRPNFAFLFGPLTTRKIGSPQRGGTIEVDWDAAYVGDQGLVELPYRYEGTWIIHRNLREGTSFQIPVVYDAAILETSAWQNCTDSNPDHQTLEVFWYYWDPTRRGCDHVQGYHYQTVDVRVGRMTPNTSNTAPEYPRLLESGGASQNLQMTFGFGYNENPATPDPDRDVDVGIAEYRKFLGWIRQSVGGRLTESNILQGEYPGATDPNLVIGRRWTGMLSGVNVTINVVAAAGVDQMVLFAESFAHDHDGVFAWMGHSRVGSGFDAARFRQIVASDPAYYSITPKYQLVYWGGCNSYSYYTLPFFEIKAEASQGADPTGTRGLDLIVNGIPSYFSMNAASAFTIFKAMIRWQNRTSYQTMINEFEAHAAQLRTYVFAAVLGDEDNALP